MNHTSGSEKASSGIVFKYPDDNMSPSTTFNKKRKRKKVNTRPKNNSNDIHLKLEDAWKRDSP